VILIDKSAWVEFLRDTGSAVCVRDVDDQLTAHSPPARAVASAAGA
jgi:hypothetical protein